MAGIGTVLPRPISEEMASSYVDYAMSVIVSRALPDVRDGLKPVQRRILYAMNEMGLTSTARYRKCAGIVGEVLKNYHPHGDAAVYDALVRMAQDFAMRYPLIDGQGNFGSIDGDSAAAMRYTEARLSALASEMLADIDKNTVDFMDNYDATLKEPTVLPAKIPNLLLNGASGIAVGMTTNIPPHNLKEIARAVIKVIDDPEVTIEELMNIVKGPDFPTGGVIVGVEGIKTAYATGHGKIIVRAKVSFEQSPSGRERIIVTELPYMVNKANLVSKIAELVSEKKLEGIVDLSDESDREGMRIVIELKKDANVVTVLNNLYKHTALQTTFGIICLSLVDGRPQVLSLKRMLQLFIEHRKNVILRRTQFDLDKAKDRAHILEGLKICLDHLDEIIKLIRSAKDPETAHIGLMQRFGLSDKQAKAVLDMRLQRLTALERSRIQAEYEDVIKLIASLEEILASERKVLSLIKEEQEELIKKYGDERRTEIQKDGQIEITQEDLIEKIDVVVSLTHRGYIKRQPLQSFRTQRRGGKGLSGHRPATGLGTPSGSKEHDFVQQLLICNTYQSVLFFTDGGQVYQLRVHEIPDRERQARGVPINNLIDISSEEKVTSMCVRPMESTSSYLLMVTRKGLIKKTLVSEYENVRRSGLIAINLQEGDRLLAVDVVKGNEDILIATRYGEAIRFNLSEVRPVGRVAMGVTGIQLEDGDEVVGMGVVRNPAAEALAVSEKGYGKRTDVSEYPRQHRAGKGVLTMSVTQKVGNVAAFEVLNNSESEVLVITQKGMVLRTELNAVRKTGRVAQGVIIMKLEQDDAVVSISPVDVEQDNNVNS